MNTKNVAKPPKNGSREEEDCEPKADISTENTAPPAFGFLNKKEEPKKEEEKAANQSFAFITKTTKPPSRNTSMVEPKKEDTQSPSPNVGGFSFISEAPKPGFHKQEKEEEAEHQIIENQDETIQLPENGVDDIVADHSKEEEDDLGHFINQGSSDDRERSRESHTPEREASGEYKASEYELTVDDCQNHDNTSPSQTPHRYGIAEKTAEIAEKRARLKLELFEIYKEQNDLKKNIDSSESYIEELKARQIIIERQQQEAIETEDFLIAANMEEEQKELEKQVRRIEDEIAANFKRIDHLEGEAKRCSDKETGSLNSFDAKLEKLQNELGALKNSYFETTDTKLKRERGALENELKRKQKSRDFVQLSLDNVAKEREELELSISANTKEHQASLDEYMEKDQELDEEIAELRAQLEAKLKDQERVKKEIQIAQNSISKIRSDFEVEFDAIQKKEERINSEFQEKMDEIGEVEAQIDKVANAEEVMELTMADYMEKELSIKTLRANVEEDINFTNELSQKREMLLNELSEAKNLYFSKRAIYKSLQETIESNKSEIDHIEKDIFDSNSSIRALEEKIPNLEQLKKQAARNRNFLEANDIAKDIKEKLDEIVLLQEKVSELASQKELLSHEIPEKEAQFETLESTMKSFKFDYEMKLFNKLKHRTREIKKIFKFFEEMRRDEEVERIKEEHDWCLEQITILQDRFKDLGNPQIQVSEENPPVDIPPEVEIEEEVHELSAKQEEVDIDDNDSSHQPTEPVLEEEEEEEETPLQIDPEEEKRILSEEITIIENKIYQNEQAIEALIEEEKFEECAALDEMNNNLLQKKDEKERRLTALNSGLF